jgi:hypothetical protein
MRFFCWSGSYKTLAFLSSLLCIDFLEPLLQLRRKLVKASLATGFEVDIIKLGLLIHFGVTKGTCKVIDTPCFVESSEHISSNDSIAHEAEISKEFMIVSLTVSEALLLIVSMTKERFLTLCTHKVFDMPVFAKSLNNPFFDGTMTGSTDGNSHLIVTGEAVEFILDFPCIRRQFTATSMTTEVIRMIWLSFELERISFINYSMTLETNVFSRCCCLFSCIAFVTESSACIFDEAAVCKRHLTTFTSETERMPIVVHCFDDSANDEFSTFSTTGSIEDIEVMFTVLSSLELVEDCIFSKGLKALGTHEAILVPDFTSCHPEEKCCRMNRFRLLNCNQETHQNLQSVHFPQIPRNTENRTW